MDSTSTLKKTLYKTVLSLNELTSTYYHGVQSRLYPTRGCDRKRKLPVINVSPDCNHIHKYVSKRLLKTIISSKR